LLKLALSALLKSHCFDIDGKDVLYWIHLDSPDQVFLMSVAWWIHKVSQTGQEPRINQLCSLFKVEDIEHPSVRETFLAVLMARVLYNGEQHVEKKVRDQLKKVLKVFLDVGVELGVFMSNGIEKLVEHL
jgi:hypothetical protein